MIQPDDFISACASREYTLFTGVPCSISKPLASRVIRCPELDYVAASSEGEAVAIAAGAFLAGRKAAVICQNSGLGNMVNPLSSLNFPFRIPALLIVTLRGEPGLNDEPQHELMGRITGEILDTLRIPSALFPDGPDLIDNALDEADAKMKASGLPYAFILKKGMVADDGPAEEIEKAPAPSQAKPEGRFVNAPEKRMSRMDAIRTIRQAVPDGAALVATTGRTGRELFALEDREDQLYVVGSMGCASGLGFGIQYAQPQRTVVVLDGDGAALMKMGTLATIGHYKPSKMVHIILDNEAYESTGGQFSVSSTVDFCAVASACGYNKCLRADTEKDLANAVDTAKNSRGPSLIHVKVACGSPPDLVRPTVKPFRVKERFMRFLQSDTNG